MKKVSNEFINLSKKIKTQDLKLTINDGELTVQEVHFMPVNIFNSIPVSRLRARKEVIAKELRYSFEGQLFKTIMQQIEITVKNANAIKGKNVNFQYGILVNNEFEYVDMGEYYIKDVEDNKNKEELVVTGYDKMINFMKPFKQSDLKLTYPCKMGQLVSRMGEVCGVDVYSTDFYNSDLIVDEDFFTIQELTYRDVLEKIAQTTLTTIFIKESKLYLCRIGESVQTLDTSFLSNLVIGEKFGPVNALVLGRGSVEDNIESVDQQSINENGRCEIRFDENEFIDSKREEVIDGMLQQINGIEYYAIEASNLGILWLDPCDVIIAKDREESKYKTIYLKASVTINTGIEGEMEANIPETTTTEYKVTTKEEKRTLKVERIAKKNEGVIQDIIEETAENSEKLSKHEQTIEGMKDTISSVETQIESVEAKADNAQSTADEVASQIQTTTTKITEVEKNIDGITANVSLVEAKAETAQSTANTANTNAQNAQSTADSINDDLEQNYYTKTETNAQIEAKAGEINLEVAKKVNDEDLTGANIVLRINNDTSESSINADKIELSANDILNLLAGNTINLTSKNIVISSDYFNVDKNGNATLKNVTITGGTISLTSDDNTNPSIKIVSPDNENNYLLINSSAIYMYYEGILRTKLSRLGWLQIYDSSGTNNVNITPTGIVLLNDAEISLMENSKIKVHNHTTPEIEKGIVSITPSAANTPTGKAVTFKTAFSGTPKVVATPTSSVVGTAVLGCGVSGQSSTGFTTYITRTNTTDTGVNWIAMY